MDIQSIEARVKMAAAHTALHAFHHVPILFTFRGIGRRDDKCDTSIFIEWHKIRKRKTVHSTKDVKG